MRTVIAAFALLTAATASTLFPETPSQSQSVEPTFEVVSIKPSTAVIGPGFSSGVVPRPDGGFRGTNIPAGTLIARAYPPTIPADIVGLPAWAMSQRYDVSATSSLSRATAEDRTAMLRGMLADRFKLAVHFEKREQPAYDLVLARSDGTLGPGLTRVDADCDAKTAADRAAAEAALAAGTPPPLPQRPDLTAPPPPCTLRSVGGDPRNSQNRVGDLLEGETSMASLAGFPFLRLAVGRQVVDKTGLKGSYRVRMTYDMRASRLGPEVAPSPDAGPSIFTAIQEQLGLRLKASRVERDTLVIDRLEHPTEN
jgi:uncharacterized protein (TIGR03435 family)